MTTTPLNQKEKHPVSGYPLLTDFRQFLCLVWGQLRPPKPSQSKALALGQRSRADIVIADDVEVLSNSQTPMMRDKLLTTIKFEAVIKPGSRIIILWIPQSEMSIYHRLEESGYTSRLWPARTSRLKAIDESAATSSYGHTLSPPIYGESTTLHPQILNDLLI